MIIVMNNNTAQPWDSTKHPYNAQYVSTDCFNSHEDAKQVITPVTPAERARANDGREQLVRGDTRTKLQG